MREFQMENPFNSDSNKKISIKNWKLYRGFTLVEMLVVMTVLVTVGSVIMGIFVVSLQGTKSSSSQQLARENGQYALEQLSKQIKFAKVFNGVVQADGTLTTDCTQTDENGNPIEYSELQITTFEDEVTTFACIASATPDTYHLTASSQSLATGEVTTASVLNQNSVQVSKCHFTCNQEDVAEPPTIGIDFDILYDVANQSSIPFHTTIVPRNN